MKRGAVPDEGRARAQDLQHPDRVSTAISTWGGRRSCFVLKQNGLAELKNLLESAKEVLDVPRAQ